MTGPRTLSDVPPGGRPEGPGGAPSADLRVTLTVTEGPHRGRSFDFTQHDTFLVGRSPEAHFALPDKDPYFSRVHFLVEVNPPLCRLLDLNSHNGTQVNGRRAQSADLRDGDEIRAGHTVLRVSITGPAPRTLTVPAALPSTAPAADQPAIPGYHILRELGRGGMGIVWLARRAADGAPVALKTVRPAGAPAPQALERFLREANTLRQLSHPHIVAFREMGEVDGLVWFAMEYVAGADAAAVARAEGPLPVGRVVPLACQLLDALAYAHARGFVHRDVKPGNLLIAGEGGREVVKLADFGLARAWQVSQLSGLTVAGTPGGTPSFMPPEQVLDFRSVRPAADQFAAAATLYNLLSGEHVYGRCADVQELFKRILTTDPVPLPQRRPDVPGPLAAAIHRALARRAEDRFPDVAALRAALLPWSA
jgi:serine/threonine-protein kinase